jgi:hypothetical protein
MKDFLIFLAIWAILLILATIGNQIWDRATFEAQRDLLNGKPPKIHQVTNGFNEVKWEWIKK